MSRLIAGDNAGIGIYKCIHCGRLIALYGDNETLPLCPRCRKCEFEKFL